MLPVLNYEEHTNIKITAFWDIAPYILEVDQRFRGAYCLHHQGDDAPLKNWSTSMRLHIAYIPEGCHCGNLKSHNNVVYNMRFLSLHWFMPAPT
jgi:hypothetical protein